MNVVINGEMRDVARRLQKAVVRKLHGNNPIGLEHTDRYYHGYLGQLVLLKALKEAGFWARYQVDVGGRGSFGNFQINVLGNKRFIRVSTAAKEFHSKVMVPKAIFDELEAQKTDEPYYNPHLYYVGVRLMGTERGQVVGYCYDVDMKEQLEPKGFDNQKVPTYYREFGKLLQMSYLTGVMFQGKVETNVMEVVKNE